VEITMARLLTEEPLTPDTVVESGRRMLGDYVRRAADGDVEAFMVFYDATCDDAYRLARCRLADVQEAAAMLVHTYVTACREAHTFESSGHSPRAWLLAILQRELMDHDRR
jgi:DNA-directed RNA polymerase specialized sigma24 family protein